MILGATFHGGEDAGQTGQKAARAYKDFCAGLGLTGSGMEKPDEAAIDALADAVAHDPLIVLCPAPVTRENILPLLRKMF